MKNINALLFSMLVIIATTVSCRKEHEEEAVTKVIDITIQANEAYTYLMPPSGDADDLMEITQQAKHFALSQITPDAQRNTLFEYTPELNYMGTDEVHVNTVEGQHTGDHHNHHNNGSSFGNCTGHHEDVETNYIFKITVIRATEPENR